MQRYRNPRERIRLSLQFLDALERDYLSYYPDKPSLFRDGLAEEVERLIGLQSLVK